MKDGRVLLIVADVCGQGLSAAVTAAGLRALFHTIAPLEDDPSAVVQRVNRYLLGSLPQHAFVTLAVVAVDPTNGALECVNAGHLPLLLATDKAVHLMQAGDTSALGLTEGTPAGARYRMRSGDVLLLYTDGVTESQDPHRRVFGDERLMSELEKARTALSDASASTLAESLMKTVSVHRGSLMPVDDTTLLVARWHGEGPRSEDDVGEQTEV
jgi:serine phosphatase RsbU (regulator of sigma subunit)